MDDSREDSARVASLDDELLVKGVLPQPVARASRPPPPPPPRKHSSRAPVVIEEAVLVRRRSWLPALWLAASVCAIGIASYTGVTLWMHTDGSARSEPSAAGSIARLSPEPAPQPMAALADRETARPPSTIKRDGSANRARATARRRRSGVAVDPHATRFVGPTAQSVRVADYVEVVPSVVADATPTHDNVLPPQHDTRDSTEAPLVRSSVLAPQRDVIAALAPEHAMHGAATGRLVATPAAPHEARLLDVAVRGSLPASTIRQALTRVLPLFTSCENRFHDATLGANGIVQMNVQIDEVGHARKPSLNGAQSSQLEHCLLAASTKLVSHAPDTGTVQVAWTLRFQPAPPVPKDRGF